MIRKDTIADRLVHIRKHKELSQHQFAKQVGITQSALSQLESGKSTLSLPTIRQISHVYSIDCNWLVHGSEGTALDDLPAKTGTGKSSMQGSRTFSKDVLIPLVSQEAHAGYIKQCDDPEFLSALDVYKIPGFESGDYRLFEIEGDSMVPTILPREIVVTELISDQNHIENGSLCVVITAEGIVAKRLYIYDDDIDNIIFKSDNVDYKTYALPRKDVIEVWLIKARITSNLGGEVQQNVERLETIESDINILKQKLDQLIDK